MREFEPAEALALIARERLTGGLDGAGDAEPLPGLRRSRALRPVSSLRWLIGGGERTPEQRIREFGSLFKSGALHRRLRSDRELLGRHADGGRAARSRRSAPPDARWPHVQIEIRDAQGVTLAAGQSGEICLRGPKVTAATGATPRRPRPASSVTGSAPATSAHLDAEGFLYLTDRKKDMIISGGENIASSARSSACCTSCRRWPRPRPSACPTRSGASGSRRSWCCSPAHDADAGTAARASAKAGSAASRLPKDWCCARRCRATRRARCSSACCVPN
jgi:hypothetical protein